MERKALTNPTNGASGPAARLDLFGPPLLVEGADAASYDQLLARLCAALKPVDIIDEIFITDVACLEWEVLRWRRLKWSLIRACGFEALEGFFTKQLDYKVYSKRFADFLAEILRDHLPEDQTDSAQTLADKCARNEEDAVDKVRNVLHGIGRSMGRVLDEARAHKAKELVQEYARREPDAVTLIPKLLTAAGVSMDALMAHPLTMKLGGIERIDQLTTIAESRRNASLREIDRRRAVLGERLRRSVQEIEDGEFEVIETTPAK